ncbi:glucosaminidase domain-containing protein [Aeribacillus composti]|uniref:glucosaminidase domain-containing protein n=1 Tax=Aeribacillus composti TaxID=1868734 RepID=UPI003D232151
MQRLIFRRSFSVFTVLVLLISLFLPAGAIAESNEIQTNEAEASYLRVVEQTDVYGMKENIVGKLLEGTVLQVEKVENDRVYFQWNNDLAYVNLQDVEILTEVDNVSWVDLQDFKILNVIEFPKEIEVLDGQENSPIAMIAAGEAYSIIEEDEQNYYIIIGHRQGAVAKDQLSETVEQPQSTEQTNDPEKGTNQEAVEDEINEESTPQEQSNENQELTSDQTKEANPDLKQENEETTKGQARLFTIQNQADSKTLDVVQQSVKFEKNDKYFEVLEDNLPVYDNRTGKLVKIGELKKGQVYPRVSDYGNWHRIQFSDYYGYVKKSATKPANGTSIKNENKSYKNSSKSFNAIENVTVYDNTSGKLVPFGTIEKGKGYKIASDYGNWWRIIFSDRVGYVRKSEVQLLFSQQDKYFEVLEDNLPVYDNRTGKLVKIGELKKGQVYPRVSDYGNWHRIQFSDYYGYVRKDSTRPANGSLIKNKNSSYKSNGRKITPIQKITVYDNSSGKLVPFGVIEKGKEYKIASDYGNWWLIVYSDRIGYVKKSEAIAEFYKNDRYFEVIKDNVPVYDNRTGKLVKVGELKKGQIYPRVSDYGNWHRIQFSDYYGYVQKSSTNYPTQKVVLPSENTQYTHSKSGFTATKTITVYDNKQIQGKLVPFGEITEGAHYQIAFDYGNWWGIIYAGRVGYVKKDDTNVKYTSYSRSFTEVLQKQMAASPQIASTEINGYVLSTAFKSIQNGYGIVSGNNWNIRSGPGTKFTQLNAATSNGYLINNEKVKILSSEIVYNSTTKKMETWYEIDYRNTWRLNSNGEYVAHKRSPVTYWVMAPPKQVEYYLNPNNFKNHAVQKFQFLDLSSPTNISVTELNKVLVGEGILEGKGKYFKDAANKYSINEIYLIAHAILETGHGRSELANGIYVDKVDGKSVPGKTVYNMYGIGAYDGCAKTCGAERAYKEGWFTPEAAIVGGARFIGQGYIHNGQNTLYKMRWNPANPGTHQYATDVRWAYNQVYDIYNLYQKMDHYTFILDIPQYK